MEATSRTAEAEATSVDPSSSSQPPSSEVVLDAKVVAMFPPRPDAIMTLLDSDDFLPGAQTLLYSLKKTLSLKQTYPPEIVVLVTPNVSLEVQQVLYPDLCTRILPVKELPAPLKSIDAKLSKGDNNDSQNNNNSNTIQRTLDNHFHLGGSTTTTTHHHWTKLRIFSLSQYDSILYIDSDCLVVKDVSHLLELNKVYVESEALIAAAPDVLPPHHFNSGVMVVRPNVQVFETMQRHASLLTTYDGSDTGFLNAYFNGWYTEFPPQARLATGYNAQQALYDMTTTTNDNNDDDGNAAAGSSAFWNVQIASDLHIVHYSNHVKPWELLETNTKNNTNSLQILWKTWYQKSKNYLLRREKEREKEERQRAREAQQRQQAATARQAQERSSRAPPQQQSQQTHPQQTHKQVAKRFKELRAEGISTQEAMHQARLELDPHHGQENDPRSQVAAMFGMM